jgi:glycosyltransferase involved in cell wall biosynthesis
VGLPAVIVAWDARKLHDGGIGSYIRNTLGALARAAREPSYVALLEPADRGTVRWPGEVREVPVRASKYGLSEHWVVPRAARAAGADLLHAPHYTLPLTWSGPAVVTIHDLTHIRFANFFPPGASLYARAVAGAAARRARVVLADSSHTRDDVVTFLRVPETKVRVVPLGVSPGLRGVPPDRLQAFRRERRLPEAYLLYVGARKPTKNLETLLAAVARIEPARRPPLVLSGPPWEPTHRLARLAASHGLDSIHFAGDLADDAELASLYSGAALYAQPSLAEGFGLPPLEAMACGTPVVTSDAGSLPETVGDAAVTLPPLDVERWTDTIAFLLGDEGRRADLIRRGLARAASFTWQRTAERTLEAYADAMA